MRNDPQYDRCTIDREKPWAAGDVAMFHVNPYISTYSDNYCHSSLLPIRDSSDYEDVKITPLETRSRYVGDSRYAGMLEPLKFPNSIAIYNSNGAYGSKLPIDRRYRPKEWFDNRIESYKEADLNRHYAERIRTDTLRVIRNAEEKIQQGQFATDRRLGERINDVNFWRNEVASELEKLLEEIERQQHCQCIVEKAINEIEGPLHIARECLYQREARKEIELVHDESEKCLLAEVEMLKKSRRVLGECLTRCKNQLSNCRALQNRLELDMKNKEGALKIDRFCHCINTQSHGLETYSDIRRFDECLTEQENWAEATDSIIQKSQAERKRSSQLRISAEALINTIAQDMWDAWNNTNSALAHRVSELIESKSKLQQHLQKIQQEIFHVKKNLQLVQKTIADKSYALKLAHTRLEARAHRPGLELCQDFVQKSLRIEINEVNNQLENMHKVLKELENEHEQLLITRNKLEHNLAINIDAIHIDKEKVCGLRRAYPINTLFKS